MRVTKQVRMTATLVLAAAITITPAIAQTQTQTPPKRISNEETLTREIRHQLLVLPFYSVFDSLNFTLNGATVTLTGQVVRPTLKANAEAAIKNIEGIASVVNQIEVLPVSATDDDLRRAVYRAIFEDKELEKYAVQALPTIHIVVKNGHVSLQGSVTTDSDKALAASRASGVVNVLSVQNQLVVRGVQNPAK